MRLRARLTALVCGLVLPACATARYTLPDVRADLAAATARMPLARSPTERTR